MLANAPMYSPVRPAGASSATLVLEGERELAGRFETLFEFEGGSGSFIRGVQHDETPSTAT